jgi:hypothetical protein
LFEDFKDKLREHNHLGKAEVPQLPPEVAAKFKERDLDLETVTPKQLFPEVLNPDGNDLSLMSGVEMEIMVTYAKSCKYILEKYLKSQEEVRMLGQTWAEMFSLMGIRRPLS